MRIQVSCVVAVIVLAAAARTALPRGGSSGGGGGGGGGIDGTVYSIDADAGSSTNHMWKMNLDGTNKTQLGAYGVFFAPSSAVHNAETWFLTVLSIPGSYYPDGSVRREAFAIRGDYDASLNNNADTRVQLTDDPLVQPISGSFESMHWRDADQKISFKARTWGAGAPVDSGLYTADLAFRADGNVVGLAAAPTRVLTFALNADGLPTLNAHSWNPDGTQVAYTDSANPGLWVADLVSGTRTRIYAGSTGEPDWAPDGTKLVVGIGGSVWTLKPDGSSLKQILRPKVVGPYYWSAFGHPHWSANGSYIVCVGWTSDAGGNDDVFRATATGGSVTNLTNTPGNEIPVDCN
jgi:hypothetical protein